MKEEKHTKVYNKISKVIKSCTTTRQYFSAIRMFVLWNKNYEDYKDKDLHYYFLCLDFQVIGRILYEKKQNI